MKKYIGLVFLLVITVFSYAGDGVIMHPNISYKNDNAEAKTVGVHILGDTVEIIGEEKTIDGKPYRVLKIKGDETQYISSAYYVIDNSKQAVVTEPSYIYKYDDVSSITGDKLNLLTFIAAESYQATKTLTKVHYLLWSTSGNYWYVNEGWIKTANISTKKDDWATATKYFLAKLEKDVDVQQKTLKTIVKINKSSMFLSLINEMLETGNLSIQKDIELDPLFTGTESELLESYEVKIFADADFNSDVLFDGVSKIQLNSRTLSKIEANGKTDYMYNITAGDITGWIHGL